MSAEFSTERFLSDVKAHEMKVIKDDGVYRHVRFRAPDTSAMFFDLVTWPGFLAYSGDMGCYVFARLTDMFEFFRGPAGRFRIDLHYWAQKLEAGDKADGVKKFSEAKFTRAVMDHLVSWIREHREQTTKEQRRALWDEVLSDVIGAQGDSGGYRQQLAANDFVHHIYDSAAKISERSPRLVFEFTDFWECNVEEFTFRFLWCCHAIQWGIGVYDTAKDAQVAPALSNPIPAIIDPRPGLNLCGVDEAGLLRLEALRGKRVLIEEDLCAQ